LEIQLKSDPTDGTPGAFVDGSKLALPSSISGVLIQRVADFIVVRDPESELYVKWDGLEAVFVRVRPINFSDRRVFIDFSFNYLLRRLCKGDKSQFTVK